MRDRAFVTLLAVVAMLAPACTSTETREAPAMASSVTFDDPWARAVDSGMTAMFGTLTNAGGHEVRIVGGESPVAGVVEIHEITADGGTRVMRPKEGGIAIAADSSHDLAPGGDHLMLMDLREPIRPGADVAITITFEDGSTLPVTAQVRDFAGGNEEYSPGGHPHG